MPRRAVYGQRESKLTVDVPAVKNVRHVPNVVEAQIQVTLERRRRAAVESPAQSVGKLRDAVHPQVDAGRPALGAYQRPRFQLRQLVIGQPDARQRRQICRFVENARSDVRDIVVGQIQHRQPTKVRKYAFLLANQKGTGKDFPFSLPER